MATDPLAAWWCHDVLVWRRTPSGSRGETFTPALSATGDTFRGFVEDGAKIVDGQGGEQVTSTARIAFPADVAPVPVGSKVRLPAKFGGRLCTVETSAVADAGGLPVPSHQMIAVI